MTQPAPALPVRSSGEPRGPGGSRQGLGVGGGNHRFRHSGRAPVVASGPGRTKPDLGKYRLASGTNSQGWLPRDLVLAGILLLAGCLAGGAVVRPPGPAGPGGAAGVRRGKRGGGFLGWQTGVLAGRWLGGPQDTSANASVAFSLRSLTVLVLWPAAVAAGFFVLRIIGLLRASVDQDADGSEGDGRTLQYGAGGGERR